MLFIIAIDPLHKMIEAAANRGLLHPILPKAAKMRCSLYADDAAIFANPDRDELFKISKILQIFGECSGLRVNLHKTEIFPIRCPAETISNALIDFPGKICNFPGKYLGLPLHTRKLRRVDVQPLLDKIGGRLPGWKGKFLSLAGRDTLVKCVLTAQPIYHLMVFPVQKWLLAQIDKLRRGFLWKGEEPEKVSGGHCLVNWSTTCTTKELGGLGILDLERLARALRLRWQWYKWKEDGRPWSGMDIPTDKKDKALFMASTIVTVGKGNKAQFWNSSWINGTAPSCIAPSLYRKAKRKNITVQKALQDNTWVSHILPFQSNVEVQEYVLLYEEISMTERNEAMEDQIIWRWTTDGEYTASSAYRIQFTGRFKKMSITPIWRARAEQKGKTFAWILLQRKILTANNLARRNWPHDPICKLCNGTPETPTHLCKNCPYTAQVWDQLIIWFGLQGLPAIIGQSSIYNWWKKCRCQVDRAHKTSFDGLVIHFWWNIWKERNRRTFQQITKPPLDVAYLIREEVQLVQVARNARQASNE